MRAGTLNHVVTFLRGIEKLGAGNVPSMTWVEEGQAFAEVKTRNARNFREANQLYERQVTEFFVRFFDSINVQADWYVMFEGKRYRITGIFPDYAKASFTKIETEFFNETSRGQ